MSAPDPNPEETRRVLETAAMKASNKAAEALGALVGQPLKAWTRVLAIREDEARAAGEPEAAAAFTVSGVSETSFYVTFPTGTIHAVRQIFAPGSDASTMPDEMITFEIANICTSHFLNTLGDLIDRHLLPSPPTSSPPAPDPTTQRDGYIIQTSFRSPGGVEFSGAFRFRAGAELIRLLHASPHISHAPM